MGVAKRSPSSGSLTMSAIAFVFTIRRAAEMLGADEDLLWQLSDDLEPEDGVLSVHDTNNTENRAFTLEGIDALRELITDCARKAS